jgi:hypothetical protein
VKVDIYHCNKEAMYKLVDGYNCDVVNTFKTLVSYWLVFTKDDLASCKNHMQSFFLTPHYRIKKNDHVWFPKTLLGKEKLGNIVKCLVEGTPVIATNGHAFLNKMQRRLGMSQMDDALVHVKKRMQITSH